jgi:hypothetical protein
MNTLQVHFISTPTSLSSVFKKPVENILALLKGEPALFDTEITDSSILRNCQIEKVAKSFEQPIEITDTQPEEMTPRDNRVLTQLSKLLKDYSTYIETTVPNGADYAAKFAKYSKSILPKEREIGTPSLA